AAAPEFARTGCAFLVSAVESLSDVVLANLEKGHTRADVLAAFDITRDSGVALRPSFMPFTPWETLDSYLELLDFVGSPDLVDQVDREKLATSIHMSPGSVTLNQRHLTPL